MNVDIQLSAYDHIERRLAIGTISPRVALFLRAVTKAAVDHGVVLLAEQGLPSEGAVLVVREWSTKDAGTVGQAHDLTHDKLGGN